MQKVGKKDKIQTKSATVITNITSGTITTTNSNNNNDDETDSLWLPW